MSVCVALISGGKDSVFTVQTLLRRGVRVACLLHLRPSVAREEENHSYRFQTAMHEAIPMLAEAMGIPLVEHTFRSNSSLCREIAYTPTPDDEIEELYAGVREARARFPEVDAVCCGAIASTYQANRLANVSGPAD